MTHSDIISAIRYYQGDVSGDDPFWGDPKAYVTLNALFFPGLDNEKARAGEGKRLNPEIVRDPRRLGALLSALAAGFAPLRTGGELTVSRVERLSEYQLQKALGRTVSFTSTSMSGFLNAYRDKRGLALIKYVLPEGTPCLIMRESLPQYLKADEAEVLLPPGLTLAIEERPADGPLRLITDMDGDPPAVLAIATAGRIMPPDAAEGADRAPFSDAAGAAAAVRTLSAIAQGETPDADDAAAYIRWKAGVAHAARAMFSGANKG